MTGPSPTQRQADAVNDLARLSVARSAREVKTDADYAKDKSLADRQYQHNRATTTKRIETQVAAIEAEITTLRDSLQNRYTEATTTAKTDRDAKLAHAKKRFKVESEAANTQLEEAGWEANAVYDANLDKVNRKADQMKRRLDESLNHLADARAAADIYLASYRKYIVVEAPAVDESEPGPNEDPIARLDEATNRIGENYFGATKLKILPIVKLDFYIFLCVVAFLVVTIGVGLVAGWMIGPIVGLVVAAVGGFLGRVALVKVAKQQITQAAGPMFQAVEDADRLADRSTHWVAETTKKFRAEVDRRRDALIKKAADTHAKLIPELEARRDSDTKAAEDRYPKALTEARKLYETDLTTAEDEYDKTLASAKADGQRDLAEIDTKHVAAVDARKATYDTTWNEDRRRLESRDRPGQVRAGRGGRLVAEPLPRLA